MPGELPISSRGIWEGSDKGWAAPSPKGLPRLHRQSSTGEVSLGCDILWRQFPIKMNELSHELRDTIHIASSEVWQLWACHKPYRVLIFLKSYLLLQGREAHALFHSACVESGRERGVNVLLLLLYGFWESNSHPKAWMAITLPLSHLSGPTMCFYSRKNTQ